MGDNQIQRKTAPHPGGWPNPAHSAMLIAEWEAREAVTLPRTYRDFMVTYDGGRLYPSILDVAVPDEWWSAVGKDTYCDPFLSWESAMERWNGDLYGDRTPKPFFFVAEDGFGLDFLMSLRAQDHGRIYCWQGPLEPWGQSGNDESMLFAQATDFSDLINQLYDTPNGDALAFWKRRKHDLFARDLILT